VGTGTDHQDRILKSILSYADCVRTLGDMPSRFTLLNTHPAIEAEPTRSLRQLFFPEEDYDEPPAGSLRRKGKGQGQAAKGKAKAAVVAAPGRDEPLDLANAGAVAVMDERTKEEALDLLSKMLTFDPEQRYCSNHRPALGRCVLCVPRHSSQVCACAVRVVSCCVVSVCACQDYGVRRDQPSVLCVFREPAGEEEEPLAVPRRHPCLAARRERDPIPDLRMRRHRLIVGASHVCCC
jgi:hypothetical protein